MWHSNFGRPDYGRPRANQPRLQTPGSFAPRSMPHPMTRAPFHPSTASFVRPAPPGDPALRAARPRPPADLTPYPAPSPNSGYGKPQQPSSQSFTGSDFPPRPAPARNYPVSRYPESADVYGSAPAYNWPNVPPVQRIPDTERSYPPVNYPGSHDGPVRHPPPDTKSQEDQARSGPNRYPVHHGAYEGSFGGKDLGNQVDSYKQLNTEIGDIVSEPSWPWQYCEDCDIHFQNEQSYRQHCLGMLHKKRQQENEEVRQRQEELKQKAMAATAKAPMRSILKNRSENRSTSREPEPKAQDSHSDAHGGYGRNQPEERARQYPDYGEREYNRPADRYQRDEAEGGDQYRKDQAERGDRFEESIGIPRNQSLVDRDRYMDDFGQRGNPYATHQELKGDPYGRNAADAYDSPRQELDSTLTAPHGHSYREDRLDSDYQCNRSDPIQKESLYSSPHDNRLGRDDPYFRDIPGRNEGAAREESYRDDTFRDRSPAGRSGPQWEGLPSHRDGNRDRSPVYRHGSRDRPSPFASHASRERSPSFGQSGPMQRDHYHPEPEPASSEGYEDDYFRVDNRYDSYGQRGEDEPITRSEQDGSHSGKDNRFERRDYQDDFPSVVKHDPTDRYRTRDSYDDRTRDSYDDKVGHLSGERDDYFTSKDGAGSLKSAMKKPPEKYNGPMESSQQYFNRDPSRMEKPAGKDGNSDLYDPWEKQSPSPTDTRSNFWSSVAGNRNIPGFDSVPGLSATETPASRGRSLGIPGLDDWSSAEETSLCNVTSNESNSFTQMQLDEDKNKVLFCKACELKVNGRHNLETHNQGKKHCKNLLKVLKQEELEPLAFCQEYLNQKITGAPKSDDFPPNFGSAMVNAFFNTGNVTSIMSKGEMATYKEFVVNSGKQTKYYCQTCCKSLYCLEMWIPHIVGIKHAKKCQEILRKVGKDTFMKRYATTPGPNPDILDELINERAEEAKESKAKSSTSLITTQNIPTITSSKVNNNPPVSSINQLVPRSISIAPGQSQVPTRISRDGAQTKGQNPGLARGPQQDFVRYPLAHLSQPKMLFPAAAQMSTPAVQTSVAETEVEVTKPRVSKQPPEPSELLAVAAGIDLASLKNTEAEVLLRPQWSLSIRKWIEDNQEMLKKDKRYLLPVYENHRHVLIPRIASLQYLEETEELAKKDNRKRKPDSPTRTSHKRSRPSPEKTDVRSSAGGLKVMDRSPDSSRQRRPEDSRKERSDRRRSPNSRSRDVNGGDYLDSRGRVRQREDGTHRALLNDNKKSRGSHNERADFRDTVPSDKNSFQSSHREQDGSRDVVQSDTKSKASQKERGLSDDAVKSDKRKSKASERDRDVSRDAIKSDKKKSKASERGRYVSRDAVKSDKKKSKASERYRDVSHDVVKSDKKKSKSSERDIDVSRDAVKSDKKKSKSSERDRDVSHDAVQTDTKKSKASQREGGAVHSDKKESKTSHKEQDDAVHSDDERSREKAKHREQEKSLAVRSGGMKSIPSETDHQSDSLKFKNEAIAKPDNKASQISTAAGRAETKITTKETIGKEDKSQNSRKKQERKKDRRKSRSRSRSRHGNRKSSRKRSHQSCKAERTGKRGGGRKDDMEKKSEENAVGEAELEDEVDFMSFLPDGFVVLDEDVDDEAAVDDETEIKAEEAETKAAGGECTAEEAESKAGGESKAGKCTAEEAESKAETEESKAGGECTAEEAESKAGGECTAEEAESKAGGECTAEEAESKAETEESKAEGECTAEEAESKAETEESKAGGECTVEEAESKSEAEFIAEEELKPEVAQVGKEEVKGAEVEGSHLQNDAENVLSGGGDNPVAEAITPSLGSTTITGSPLDLTEVTTSMEETVKENNQEQQVADTDSEENVTMVPTSILQQPQIMSPPKSDIKSTAILGSSQESTGSLATDSENTFVTVQAPGSANGVDDRKSNDGNKPAGGPTGIGTGESETETSNVDEQKDEKSGYADGKLCIGAGTENASKVLNESSAAGTSGMESVNESEEMRDCEEDSTPKQTTSNDKCKEQDFRPYNS